MGGSLDGQNRSSNSADSNTNNNGDRSAPDGNGDGGGTLRTSGSLIPVSPSGAPPLSTRVKVDLYRRLRQGLVAAEDLLPEAMLSAAAKASSSCDDDFSPAGALLPPIEPALLLFVACYRLSVAWCTVGWPIIRRDELTGGGCGGGSVTVKASRYSLSRKAPMASTTTTSPFARRNKAGST